MRIELPWPPKKLSRNGSQADYRGKADAARKYKDDCRIAVLAAKGRVYIQPGTPVMLVMTYHAPDRRRRDLDNLLAMTKQGVDAIAESLGVDDSQFEFTLRRGAPRRPAEVVVTI
ncbi:hypothetical protein AB1K62_14455 [Parasphingorhabdus sp. JC815]|uniref:hypothetical protein n=1 Tax=Parasphingorhabdus sp. JC815 TaxID=3232140 RepID=UPI0034591B0F